MRHIGLALGLMLALVLGPAVDVANAGYQMDPVLLAKLRAIVEAQPAQSAAVGGFNLPIWSIRVTEPVGETGLVVAYFERVRVDDQYVQEYWQLETWTRQADGTASVTYTQFYPNGAIQYSTRYRGIADPRPVPGSTTANEKLSITDPSVIEMSEAAQRLLRRAGPST